MAQYALYRPSGLQAMFKAAPGLAGDFSPFGQAHRSTIERQESRISPVLHLQAFCGPSAILRRVVAVIVDAIKLMLGRWTTPHVCDEVGKITPTLANGYPTATIVGIGPIFRSVTPPQHGAPYSIFGGNATDGRVAVPDSASSAHIRPVASARLAMSTNQLVASDDPDGSARTLRLYEACADGVCDGPTSIGFGHNSTILSHWSVA